MKHIVTGLKELRRLLRNSAVADVVQAVAAARSWDQRFRKAAGGLSFEMWARQSVPRNHLARVARIASATAIVGEDLTCLEPSAAIWLGGKMALLSDSDRERVRLVIRQSPPRVFRISLGEVKTIYRRVTGHVEQSGVVVDLARARIATRRAGRHRVEG